MQMPIMINLSQMNVVVIGGGRIATRRVELLLEYAKQIHIVSPQITEHLNEIIQQQQVTWHQKEFEASDVENADLVIAATNDDLVNDEVKQHLGPHTLFNHVGNAKESNITFPNQLRRGKLTISVSTDGASPKLAKQIIQNLAQTYDESYEDYIDFLYESRQLIKEKALTSTEKQRLLQDILTEKYKHPNAQQSFINWLKTLDSSR